MGCFSKDFYRGYPAVLKNKYGKGKAYYIGFRDTGQFLSDFYDHILAETNMAWSLPEGVTVHTRCMLDTCFTFIENYSEDTVNVMFSREYTDMETGLLVSGGLELEGYGIRILKSSLTE